MSLKAVELQVALPRTQEAGRLQEQLQQRPMQEQQGLIADRKQFDQITRQRASNLDETVKNRVADNDEQKQKGDSDEQSERRQAKGKSGRTTEEITDPLRGHHIDISL